MSNVNAKLGPNTKQTVSSEAENNLPIIQIGPDYFYERGRLAVPPVNAPRRIDGMSSLDPYQKHYWTDGTYVFNRSFRLGLIQDFNYLGFGWSSLSGDLYYNEDEVQEANGVDHQRGGVGRGLR